MTDVHITASPVALAAPADAPVVVLIHGAMDRSASFGRSARLLADLPVIRYDRRGYGHSTDLGVGDLDLHVADVVTVLARRPAILVGHSIGGVIALAAAQREPALVMSIGAWEAPMPWAPWWPKSSAGGAALGAVPQTGTAGSPGSDLSEAQAGDAAERFMRKMIGDDRWGRLPPGTRAARRAEGRALVADVGSLRRETAPYDATALAQPVVAGCGSESVPYHRRAATELAATVVRAELMVVEGASHGAHLSHPRDFAGFVRRAAALGGVESVDQASTGRTSH